MMRLYWSMAQQLLILLAYNKYIVKTPWDIIYKDVYSWYRNAGYKNDDLLYQALKQSRLDYLAPQHTYDELIETFKGRVSADQVSNKHEGDLIDHMIELLQLPFGGNVLAPSTLNKLRRALMDPLKMDDFRIAVEKAELFCGNCTGPLKDRESVTLVRDAKTNTVTLYCLKCVTPTSVRCKSCGDLVPFSDRFSSKKGKVNDCGHKGERDILNAVKAPENKPEEAPYRGGLGDYIRGAMIEQPVHVDPHPRAGLAVAMNRDIGMQVRNINWKVEAPRVPMVYDPDVPLAAEFLQGPADDD